MAPDLSTVAALVGMAGVIGGLVFGYLKLRLRVLELEKDDQKFNSFMERFERMVAASEAGVVIQRNQLVTAQRAWAANQSVQERAIQLKERDASHNHLLNWLGFGLKVYDSYRKRHPHDDEDEEE